MADISELYHVVAFHRGPKFTPTIKIMSSHFSEEDALENCPENECCDEGKWSEYTDYSVIKTDEKLVVDAW